MLYWWLENTGMPDSCCNGSIVTLNAAICSFLPHSLSNREDLVKGGERPLKQQSLFSKLTNERWDGESWAGNAWRREAKLHCSFFFFIISGESHRMTECLSEAPVGLWWHACCKVIWTGVLPSLGTHKHTPTELQSFIVHTPRGGWLDATGSLQAAAFLTCC